VTDDVTTIGPEPVPDTATQYMVPMRDGTLLATDVYLPEGEGPFEVVLTRLPYDKNSRYMFIDGLAPHFTARGYAFVVQDVRGKFRSGGETIGLVGEADDGYDSIEWVVQQPWSAGVVGMWGDSYFGFTQWAAVTTEHPALKAIVPGVTSAQLFIDLVDGAVSDVPWMISADYLSHYWVDNNIYDFALDYERRPPAEIFEDAFARVGKRSHMYDLLVPVQQPLDAYPHGHPFDAKPIPVLHRVGWFDNLLTVSMRDYVTVAARPEWATHQYLWAESIDHESYQLELAPITPENDHLVNADALARFAQSYLKPSLDFYDVFLKGIRPVESLAKVNWHLGHVGFRQSTSWPPPEATELRLLLSNLSGATNGEGVLGDTPAAEGDSVSWVYDPSDLVASSVPNSFAFLLSFPDEQELLTRSDVVSFITEPFDSPLDIAGPVDLWIALSSTCQSTDLFAKLFDVDPEGVAHMVLRGQACLADTSGTSSLRVELGHTGYRVRPGHRLCLALFSSDFPEFVPHPGTEGNRWTEANTKPSTQTIMGGAVTAPTLVLSVLA